MKNVLLGILLIAVLLAGPVTVYADYTIVKSSVNSGGLESAVSTNYNGGNTVGQAFTGQSNSTNYTMFAGFWNMPDSITVPTAWSVTLHAEGQQIGGAPYQFSVEIGVADEESVVYSPGPPSEYTTFIQTQRLDWSGPYVVDIRQEGEDVYDWIIEFNPHGNVPPPDPRSATISWDPDEFNPEGTYVLIEGYDGSGDTLIADMRATTTYVDSGGNEYLYYTLRHNLGIDRSIWYVSVTGDDFTGDGSLESPYRTIQYGIGKASSGDSVMVLNGTYVENIDYTGKNLLVTSNYLISGDTLDIINTVIDGNFLGPVVTFANNEGPSAALKGFTIINGNAENGGGVHCFQSAPVVSNNRLFNNSASLSSGFGGGLYAHYGSPVFIDNKLMNNSASRGAGIGIRGSNPQVIRNEITDNNGSLGGGGILITGFSEGAFQSNLIANNHSDSVGGGVCVWQSEPAFYNNTIANNSSVHRGGGFDNISSTTAMFNNIVCGNDSPLGSEVSLIDFQGIPGALYSNNTDICGGIAGVYIGPNQRMVKGKENLISDPLFRDTLGGDFHLQSTDCGDLNDSPLIDAGDVFTYDSILDCAWGLGELRSDMGAYGGGVQLPPVHISMFPYGTPVSINPGESFQFTGVLKNTSMTDTLTNDVWIMLQLPGGNQYGPLNTFSDISVQPGKLLAMDDVGQLVPAWAPIGDYSYIAYLGSYPDSAIDSSVFDFSVVPPKMEFNPRIRIESKAVAQRSAGMAGINSHSSASINSAVAGGGKKIDEAEAADIFAEHVGFEAEWVMSGWFGETINLSFYQENSEDESSPELPSMDKPADQNLPADFRLYQSIPNPFNSATTIRYDLPRDARVLLDLYNIRGQKVATLVDDYQTAGFKSVHWDASDYSSGIYFYKLTAGEKNFTKRMTLLK